MACIRLLLLYGSEIRGFANKIGELAQAYDGNMLRYVTGIALCDPVTSEELAVADSCEKLCGEGRESGRERGRERG